jgi:hypothetical protein
LWQAADARCVNTERRPNHQREWDTPMATTDLSARNPRRNPRSPLPGAGTLDEAIATKLAAFDRIPRANRDAAATISSIIATLSTERVLALLEVAIALRNAEREEQEPPAEENTP